MLGKTRSRCNQQQMQTSWVPRYLKWKKITATKIWWSFFLFLKMMTDLNGLVFHTSFRKYCANPLSCPSPSSPQKPLKSIRRLMGLHINSNSWYQVDHHIIFEKSECLKHWQYWRKPCCTIIISLLTEFNSQIYSLFYILKEYLLSDELSQTCTIICWKGKKKWSWSCMLPFDSSASWKYAINCLFPTWLESRGVCLIEIHSISPCLLQV